jgi:hypothetical protein
MFLGVENFGIESRSKSVFEKGDIHVVIIIELITIVSSIFSFQLELIPMFFHMNSTKKFTTSILNWRFVTIVVIVMGIRGVGIAKVKNNC